MSKVYDGTTTASLAGSNFNFSSGDVIGSDVVTLVSPRSGTYASVNAGTGITVTATGLSLTGAAAGNYTLAATSLSGAIGIITPKTLTATLTGTASKVYDGTTTASLAGSNFNFSSGDVIGSDVVTLVSPKSGTYASVNAGTGITVTATGLSLTGARSRQL